MASCRIRRYSAFPVFLRTESSRPRKRLAITGAKEKNGVQSPPDKPFMPYASHVAHGTGRTPIGIVLFACSHLLLGGVLLLTDWILFQRLAMAPPGASAPLEWLVV